MKRLAAFIILAAIAANAVIAGTITGTITDNSNGQPIANLWVNVYYYNGDWVNSDCTDANGFYIISNLAAWQYRVSAGGDGTPYAWAAYNNQVQLDKATLVNVSAGQEITNINVSLSLGASISGVVKNSAGIGQANVQVNCWADNGYGTGNRTDTNGFYKCGGLPIGYNCRCISAIRQQLYDYKNHC